MTATFIKKALEYRHTNDFFLCEVKTGPTWYGDMGKIDAWAMAKSWANPRVVAYEIKVDRNDFLNDNKWMKYLPCCNEFYFACPKKLIKESEVPKNAGLVYISDKGRARTVIKAKYKDEIDNAVFQYILMNRVDSDGYPFHDDRKEWLKEWLQNKQENRDLGWKVGTELAKQLVDKELNNYKDKAKQFDEIEKLLETASIKGYFIPNKIEKLIQKSKTKDNVKAEKLEKLFEKMNDAFREIIIED